GAEPHRRALAAATSHDEPVLPLRADGYREGVPGRLHGDRPPARQGHDRGARPRRADERALRRLLRPDRLRVLGAQEHWRRGGPVLEEEYPSARPRVPPRRAARHRPAQRRWLRRARLVAASLAPE